MKRRWSSTLLTVAAAFFNVATVHSAEVTLRVGTLPIIDMAQFYAAVDQGYFKQESIDAQIVTGSGGAALLPALTSGNIQISFNNIVSALQAVEQGIPLQIIAPGTAMPASPPDITPLVVAKDGPIRTAKDLEGRVVAVNNLNNIVWLYVRAFLENKGADLRKIRFVEVPFPQMQDALLSGRVDAAGLTEPFTTRARESGKTTVLGYPYTETQANLQSAMLFAMHDWARDNKDLLARFLRAYQRGVSYVNQHQKDGQTVRIIAGYTKLDPAVLSKILFPIFTSTVRADGIEETAKLMVRHGMLKKVPDVKGMVYSGL